MTRARFLLLALLAPFFCAYPAWSVTAFEGESVKALAGKNVLLLVGPANATSGQAAHYHELLKKSGADPAQYPVYQTPRLSNEVAGKLGLGKRGSNYGVLVKWGNPARFGPARVLEPGVVNELTSDGDVYVLVENALLAQGQQALLDKLPPDMAALRPRAQLVIENVTFQANGRPVYLVNTKVRIRNEGKVDAKDVTIVFLVENAADGSWYELGRHSGLKVVAGNTVARDLVRTTYDTPLLNEKKEIQPVRYQVRVEYAGGTPLETTDQFEPKLIEDQ